IPAARTETTTSSGPGTACSQNPTCIRKGASKIAAFIQCQRSPPASGRSNEELAPLPFQPEQGAPRTRVLRGNRGRYSDTAGRFSIPANAPPKRLLKDSFRRSAFVPASDFGE